MFKWVKEWFNGTPKEPTLEQIDKITNSIGIVTYKGTPPTVWQGSITKMKEAELNAQALQNAMITIQQSQIGYANKILVNKNNYATMAKNWEEAVERVEKERRKIKAIKVFEVELDELIKK